MNKRMLSITLALIMILGSLTTVFGHDLNTEVKAGQFLKDNGVLVGEKNEQGQETGDLLLGEKLLRKDSVIVYSRLLAQFNDAKNYEVGEYPTYVDVKGQANLKAYAPYIGWAQDNGHFVGSEKNEFIPEKHLTAREYAVVMLKSLGYEVELWNGVFEQAEELGLFEHVDVEADTEITRGQMAIMTVNALATDLADGSETLADKLGINMPAEEKPATLEVVDINALNASEIKVDFNQELDKATATNVDNFEIKVNNKDEKENIEAIGLSEDGKSVILLFNQEKLTFSNGDKFVLQTNNNIKSETGIVADRFVSKELTFNEAQAPKLLNVVLYGDNQLRFTFDMPVNSYSENKDKDGNDIDVSLIKVDGLALKSKDLKPVFGKKEDSDHLGTPGKYVYSVKLDDNKKFLEEGTHKVVLYKVKDTSQEYAKVANVLTGEYVVDNSMLAPEVVDVHAVNANRFFIETNVKLDDSYKLVVNKGSHEFPEGKVSEDKDEAVLDSKIGTYKGKSGIWAVVTDSSNNKAEQNPLYRGNEKSVKLDVTLEGYSSNGLIGKKSVESVTLNKADTKPVLLSSDLKDGSITAIFNDKLVLGEDKTALTSDDVFIADKDGVVLKFDKVKNFAGTHTTEGNTSITLAKEEIKKLKAPYTVEIKANKLQNEEVLNDVEKYLANTAKNDTIVFEATTQDAANFKYTEFELTKENFTVEDNVITINYGMEMDDSAINPDNYMIDTNKLPSGTKVYFIGDKTQVRIVLPSDLIKESTEYMFEIDTNVKTSLGSRIVDSIQTKNPTSIQFGLEDNIKPELKSETGKYVAVEGKEVTDKLEVEFNEDVKDVKDVKDNFKVTVNGSEIKVKKAELKDNKVTLTLEKRINVKQEATVEIVKNNDGKVLVEDMAGNPALVGSKTVVKKVKYVEAVAKPEEKEVTKEEVETALAEAKEALEKVEEDKKAALEKAIEGAEKVLENEEATSEELETALNALNAAMGKEDDIVTEEPEGKIEVTGVTADIEPKEIKVEETAEITVTAKNGEDTVEGVEYEFKSSDDKVATVDENGKVTGVAEGKATITVTTTNAKEVKTATVEVTVEAKEDEGGEKTELEKAKAAVETAKKELEEAKVAAKKELEEEAKNAIKIEDDEINKHQLVTDAEVKLEEAKAAADEKAILAELKAEDLKEIEEATTREVEEGSEDSDGEDEETNSLEEAKTLLEAAQAEVDKEDAINAALKNDIIKAAIAEKKVELDKAVTEAQKELENAKVEAKEKLEKEAIEKINITEEQINAHDLVKAAQEKLEEAEEELKKLQED